MIVNKIVGNIKNFPCASRRVERLYLSWDELVKRIIRKTTDAGTEVALVLSETGSLHEGDIIYADEEKLIFVDVRPLDAIVARPKDLFEMGRICYALGNRHLPIFIEGDDVITPYDPVTWDFLYRSGFDIERCERRISHACRLSGRHH